MQDTAACFLILRPALLGRLFRKGLDAFAEGWADSKAERRTVGEPALEAAYDRLLRIECCPDSLGLPASGVDRIKVSWR